MFQTKVVRIFCCVCVCRGYIIFFVSCNLCTPTEKRVKQIVNLTFSKRKRSTSDYIYSNSRLIYTLCT